MAERLLIVCAALAGLLGVAFSAMATHLTGAGTLEVSASFLLFHAATLLGLSALLMGAHVGRRIGLLAGFVLLVGLVLFSGDLALRALAGRAMFANAAPTGGVLLMLGWVGIGVSAFVRR
ncbi:DUF423 domain-containing protein [Salinarimonas ramus]|uniref:Membrane protein n=1 Tax=Salinarimonas ramus TaxID=690164 RepID=A0A917QFE5_9HYPH|nr:DUF423 domain-containing protein [Salinarimonas ramus]GGK47784.1 membrane protein [Salinarimonas ramus]